MAEYAHISGPNSNDNRPLSPTFDTKFIRLLKILITKKFFFTKEFFYNPKSPIISICFCPEAADQ